MVVILSNYALGFVNMYHDGLIIANIIMQEIVGKNIIVYFIDGVPCILRWVIRRDTVDCGAYFRIVVQSRGEDGGCELCLCSHRLGKL